MITGDISLGLALSSTNRRKTFFYEIMPWKDLAVKRLRELLAADLRVESKTVQLFFSADTLRKKNRGELQNVGRNLARVLKDTSLQERLHTSIEKRLSDWDVIDNTLGIAAGVLSRGALALTREREVSSVMRRTILRVHELFDEYKYRIKNKTIADRFRKVSTCVRELVSGA